MPLSGGEEWYTTCTKPGIRLTIKAVGGLQSPGEEPLKLGEVKAASETKAEVNRKGVGPKQVDKEGCGPRRNKLAEVYEATGL